MRSFHVILTALRVHRTSTWVCTRLPEDNNLDLFDRAWERADTVNLVLSEMDLIKQVR